ncbi:N-acetylmuramic acid 6-phosphate etherase [Pseudothermotoga thermarum]|uniref:N-acetylmuramic acid 6-phosphate etherase n=1 Tax=Pseudothermotoga thermarum DSM 5069 TaxID=688269 RepID=F7YVD7_9THEM|nr:N-acetylmuramic acid 6-phosphate etherase [Pseudothermotoga thermarum]AEH50440.1 glucokinase regulatory-like protein [Pseudothermotoga thermarum DSM 5069]
MNISNLPTEIPNPKTKDLDNKETIEILKLINEEDALVALAVRDALKEIDKAVNLILECLKANGRVFYVGAGTSGRVAFIDAVELVPTYSLPEGIVIPVIAGGYEALSRSIEGVEDNEELGAEDLKRHSLNSKDIVVGLTASGRTLYVGGALRYAKQLGCKTILICNVGKPTLSNLADVVISVETGPEVVAGSTRMKAGTAQKMVLNMISTTVMVKMGKVYDNLMVDVMVLNEKLKERAKNIVSRVTGVDSDVAEKNLERAGYNVKLAILTILTGKDIEECQKIIQKEPNLRKAIELMKAQK